MKKALLLGVLLSLCLLSACTDEKESSSKEQTTNETLNDKQNNQPTEQTLTDDQLDELLTTVKDKAFSSKEHEGTVLLEEIYMKDGEKVDYKKHDITYRQNDELEGMYGENQLYYKRQYIHEKDIYDSPTIYEGYIQPDQAVYRYNNYAGWNGWDLKTVGEIGYERLNYLSPADVLSMLELNEDSLNVKAVNDEIVTVSFTPSDEDRMNLFYSIIEQESFYLDITDIDLQFDEFELNLLLSREQQQLEVVTVYYKQSNIADANEYYEISYNQQYTATKLSEEIRPTDDVFKEANLTIWD